MTIDIQINAHEALVYAEAPEIEALWRKRPTLIIGDPPRYYVGRKIRTGVMERAHLGTGRPFNSTRYGICLSFLCRVGVGEGIEETYPLHPYTPCPDAEEISQIIERGVQSLVAHLRRKTLSYEHHSTPRARLVGTVRGCGVPRRYTPRDVRVATSPRRWTISSFLAENTDPGDESEDTLIQPF